MLKRIVIILFAAAAAAYCANMAWKSKQQERWPHTQGQITSGRTVYITRYRSSNYWQAEIGYQYSVAGINHAGETDIRESSQATALNELEHYPLSTRSDVYYNPENPADSTLLPGGKTNSWLLGAGTCALVAALGLGIMAKGTSRNADSKPRH